MPSELNAEELAHLRAVPDDTPEPRASKDELASAKAELGAWLVEHPGWSFGGFDYSRSDGGVFAALHTPDGDMVLGIAPTEHEAIRDALARATGGDRG